MAPGGAGKTALLADWARRASLPVAWYALDPADRDTRRLLAGLCAAVEQAIPGTMAAAHRALASGAPEAAVVGLLLGALEGQALALVLDDVQHLDDLPAAATLWEQVLRFRPPSLAPVILSRTVPPLGFAALAALDDALDLGHDDLRFDAAETAELLCAHGLDIQPAVDLAGRSGGWATGILLLARAASPGAWPLRGRVETLMGYLGAQVLATLPRDLRLFLSESAALGPSTPRDADAILGRRDSAALYAEVAARGLFLEEHDGLYHDHDLFADYLVATLQREDPDRLHVIRRAAVAWWTGHGDLPRALELLAVEEDWEALTRRRRSGTPPGTCGACWASPRGGRAAAPTRSAGRCATPAGSSRWAPGSSWLMARCRSAWRRASAPWSCVARAVTWSGATACGR